MDYKIKGAAVDGVKANAMVFQQPKNNYAHVFEQLSERQDLSMEDARECFRAMFSGSMSPACIGTFLMGLKTKGESYIELAAGVEAALEEAVEVPEIKGMHLDVVGTGGDKMSSFNCSTATALVLAAMGYTVTKHGNRSVSSIVGSADILEAIGLPINTPPSGLMDELERSNFAFLFAPNYHPAFKRIVPVRKEIGAHTIFNIMGPLINPLRPTHQLVGVPSNEHLMLMAETLALTGVERAAVVHGAGGFDEVSPCGMTDVVFVRDGWVKRDQIDPARVGMQKHHPDDLRIRGLEDAVEVFMNALEGRAAPAIVDTVSLNVATMLMLVEDAHSFETCYARARDAVKSGCAAKKFFSESNNHRN